MKNNNETKNKKNAESFTSLRVKKGTKDDALKILESINKKDFGRKVSIDDLVTKVLENVTKEDIQLLQKNSLRNKDRQTIVHQFYCKKVKKVSEDEFIGVTMSDGYFQFLKDNRKEFEKLGV